jgi:exonuclease 1
MKRTTMLIDAGITPFIVFDGGDLPMKEKTKLDRKARRADMMAKGKKFYDAGNMTKAHGTSEVTQECFSSCVAVTPLMALEWIKRLKEAGVQFVVAPYEADAQLGNST